jgi:hypothetical protein
MQLYEMANTEVVKGMSDAFNVKVIWTFGLLNEMTVKGAKWRKASR